MWTIYKKHTKKSKLGYIYKNDLDKACFHLDMAYNKYKDLEKRTQPDIVLKNETFEMPSNPKYNGYKRELASMIYKFFNSKSKGSGLKKNSGKFFTKFTIS